jgi:hypothetical protein
MKYKNQLGACFAILFLCCAAMLFSCAGCGGMKDKKLPSDETKDSSIILNESLVKSNQLRTSTAEKISLEQYSLLNRKTFDTNVKSFDTANTFHEDTLPFRLLPLEDRIGRMSKYIQVLGLRLKRTNEGYIHKGNNKITRMSYPGVLAQYKSGWGDYVTEIIFIDEKSGENLIIDVNELTPYNPSNFESIKPGMFDFENMVIGKNKTKINFKNDATDFYENRILKLQKTTDWSVLNFQLLALNNNNVIGFESTILVLNQLGEEVYRKILPYATQYEFITTDNKYLIYAPLRSKYMINSFDSEEQLVILDLENNIEIHRAKFNSDKMKFTALRESRGDNILNVKFKIYNPNKEKEDFIYRYYELDKRTYYEISKSKTMTDAVDSNVSYLQQIPYDITKY